LFKKNRGSAPCQARVPQCGERLRDETRAAAAGPILRHVSIGDRRSRRLTPPALDCHNRNPSSV